MVFCGVWKSLRSKNLQGIENIFYTPMYFNNKNKTPNHASHLKGKYGTQSMLANHEQMIITISKGLL